MKKYKYNTPIHSMNYNDGGNKFYIKRDDLLPFSFGGNKVRIAEHYFRDMVRKGCDCIITYGSSQSNLSRVIANMSKSKGIHCYVISSSDNADELTETNNSKIVRSLEADLIYCNKDNVAETVLNTINDCKSKGLKPYYIYGDIYGKGNEEVAVQAYIEAYDEICEYERDAGYKFDYIFHASGTGMTQSGLICGKLKWNDTKKIIGISIARGKELGRNIIIQNVSRYCNDQGVAYQEHDIHFEDKYICGGYGKYNYKIFRVVKEVFNLDGIPLDTTYTGKAFWGMIEYLKENKVKDSRVLFIHTGGLPLFFDNLNKI
jgi:D-cysteine desulfhydrase